MHDKISSFKKKPKKEKIVSFVYKTLKLMLREKKEVGDKLPVGELLSEYDQSRNFLIKSLKENTAGSLKRRTSEFKHYLKQF